MRGRPKVYIPDTYYMRKRQNRTGDSGTRIHHQPPHPQGSKTRGAEGKEPALSGASNAVVNGAALAHYYKPMRTARPLTTDKSRTECRIITRLNLDFSGDVMTCETCVWHVPREFLRRTCRGRDGKSNYLYHTIGLENCTVRFDRTTKSVLHLDLQL